MNRTRLLIVLLGAVALLPAMAQNDAEELDFLFEERSEPAPSPSRTRPISVRRKRLPPPWSCQRRTRPRSMPLAAAA